VLTGFLVPCFCRRLRGASWIGDLDAAILGGAWLGAVVGDGHGFTISLRRDAVAGYAVGGEPRDDGVGAILGSLWRIPLRSSRATPASGCCPDASR